MEIRVYLTQTYRSSVGIRRNGHDFGYIVDCKQATTLKRTLFRLPFSERWSFRREYSY